MEDYSVIGKRIPRVDGRVKVTGEAKYAADYEMPGILWCKIVRSPYPHAEILSVDTREAEKMGAVTVTYAETPKVKYNERQVSIPEKTYRDRTVLPDKARHVGEGLMAVAAKSEILAEKAMRAVKVEYEPLEPVMDPMEAMEPEATKVYEEIMLGDVPLKVEKNIACYREVATGQPL